MKFGELKAAMKVFDDLAERGRRFSRGICEQDLSYPGESTKKIFFKSLVRGHFMRIAVQANGY